MIDLSIIVPAYNVEKFLEQCIKSVTPNKKAKITYEIIIVENNSTDKTLEKCNNLAKKDKNIKIVFCKKQGLSEARNFGLKKAKGKYVWFVDSDDYVKTNSAEEIIKTAHQTDADAVMIPAEKVNEDGKPWQGPNTKIGIIDLTSKDWDKKFVMIGKAAWQIICKRSFLTKNNLFYDEGIIHEDMALMSSFILYTKKITSCQNATYYYRQREGSILHKKEWNKKELDIFVALNLLIKRFKKAKMLDKYHDELEYFYIWNLLDDAARTFKKFPQGKIGFKKIRQTMRRDFPHWRRNKYFRQKPIMVRLRCYTAFYGVVW